MNKSKTTRHTGYLCNNNGRCRLFMQLLFGQHWYNALPFTWLLLYSLSTDTHATFGKHFLPHSYTEKKIDVKISTH